MLLSFFQLGIDLSYKTEGLQPPFLTAFFWFFFIIILKYLFFVLKSKSEGNAWFEGCILQPQ